MVEIYFEVVIEVPVVVYILIRVEAGKVWDVAQAIGKISGVDRSNVVTGPYDVIAYAVLPSTEDLREVMEGIHSVDGVNRTETCIAI
ncbi:MAG: Lrp/AsnC ligand binding domain-containing protein [Promethearchaeota archaeon]